MSQGNVWGMSLERFHNKARDLREMGAPQMVYLVSLWPAETGRDLASHYSV